MFSRERRFPLAAADMLAVLVFVLAVPLALAFGGRALEVHRLRRYNDRLRAEIEVLEQQQKELEERLEYVQSPQYVEEVAREQYGWTKPGETLVVPHFTYRPAQPPASTQAPASEAVSQGGSYWSAWRELLFGPFD